MSVEPVPVPPPAPGPEPSRGQPALTVGRPTLPPLEHLMPAIEATLRSGWLTNDGPRCRAFERAVADRAGTTEAVAVTNATAALELLLEDLPTRGEVILPSFTFIATAHAVARSGHTPVFADVDPVSCCLSPTDAAARVTPRTVAILGVHLWGNVCRVDELAELARRHGLRLYFDAAHGIGGTEGTRRIGSFGDAEAFSFHATKIVSSLEGGVVTTNDPDLAERLRRRRAFGVGPDGSAVALGTNAKLNEVSATVGLASLALLDELIDIHRQRYAWYRRALDGVPGVRLRLPTRGGRRNHQYVVLEVTTTTPGPDREHLLARLRAAGIVAKPYFAPPCHHQEPHRSAAGPRPDLPVTEDLAARLLCLPTGPGVRAADVWRVAGVVDSAMQRGSDAGRADL